MDAALRRFDRVFAQFAQGYSPCSQAFATNAAIQAADWYLQCNGALI